MTVTVETETDGEYTVVVAPAPPSAELPPIVTVVVTCVARLLAAFSAFLIAEPGIGEPAIMQANCRRRTKHATVCPSSLRMLCCSCAVSWQPPDSASR